MKRKTKVVMCLSVGFVFVLLVGYAIVWYSFNSPPKDPEMRLRWYLQRGQEQEARGDLSGAESSFRQAIALDPTDGETRSDLAGVLQAQGKLQAAEMEHREAVKLAPKSAIAHNNLGAFLSRQGHITEATAEFERAVELNPQYDAALVNLGILHRDDQPQLAFGYLEKALQRNPYNSVGHRNMAIVLEKLSKPQSEILSHVYMEHVSRGTELLGDRLFEEAEAAYKKAIEVNPSRSCAYVKLAFAYELLRRYDDALAMYERARQHDQAQAPVLGEWIRYVESHKAQRFPPMPQPRLSPDGDCLRP